MQIKNIEELLELIKRDLLPAYGLCASNRFPIRVILLNSFNDMRNIIDSLDYCKIDLSDEMPSDNYWFSTHDLLKIVENIKHNSIIYPISEAIRFLPKDQIEGFISTVLGIENNSVDSYRVIIPLVGLENKLTKVYWNNYHRREEGAKIWFYQSNNYEPVDIYKMDKKLETKIMLIENNKQWLSYWSCKNSKPLISVNQSLNDRWDNFLPDSSFIVSKIDNYKELIESFYNFSFPREYKEEEAKFWYKLISYCEKQGIDNFYNLATDLLNVKNLSLMSLTSYLDKFYQQNDEFIHWLVIICIEKYYANSYLNNCIKKLKTDLIGIEKELYYNIINNYNESHIKERQELISYYYNQSKSIIDSFIDKFIDSFINETTKLDNSVKLSILTNVTSKEKIEKLKLLSNLTLKKFLSSVNDYLPDVANYLNFESVKQFLPISWMLSYFKNYNIGKAMNQKQEIIDEIIFKINESEKSFYDWYTSIDNLSESDDIPIYQIDGLGIEWLPFVYNYLVSYMKGSITFENIETRKSYVPSITSINKVDNSIFIIDGSLDKYIHSKMDYEPFVDLIYQLEVVKNVINKIVSNKDPVFYITGDHGLSYQCLSYFDRKGLQYFKNAEHEGRCYKSEKRQNSGSDFIYNGGYYIALNHNSLSSLPRREVHGGATPEEVLVPLIKVRRELRPTDYKVLFIKEHLSLYDNLLFKIKPSIFINPIVKVNGIVIDVNIEEDLFTISSKYFSTGRNSVNLVFNGIEKNYVINKEGAIKEEELF